MEKHNDEHTNVFNNWEALAFTNVYNHTYSSSSSSSSSSSHTHSPSLIAHNQNRDPHLSIFHPSNHEDLPLTQPQPPCNSLLNSNPDSNSSSIPQKPQFIKWFDFALHLWNSKLLSFLSLLRSRRFVSSFLPVTTTASILGFLWFWVRRRRRRLLSHCGKENVEHLKLVIKEKNEKLEKFEGVDFRRGQRKMHILLTTFGVAYVLTQPKPEEAEDETIEQTRRRNKWDNDDYVCRGHILNEDYTTVGGDFCNEQVTARKIQSSSFEG